MPFLLLFAGKATTTIATVPLLLGGGSFQPTSISTILFSARLPHQLGEGGSHEVSLSGQSYAVISR